MSTTRSGRREDLTFGKDDRESRKRLRELILFIAERCLNNPTFGAVKLNKILFFADFISLPGTENPLPAPRTGSSRWDRYPQLRGQ